MFKLDGVPECFVKGGGLFLALLLTGCAVISSGSADRAGAADSAENSTAEYTLRSGDQVFVQVYREPNLSGSFVVDGSERIQHPLCGPLKAGGLTVDQLAARLKEILDEKYLVNPRVTVSIESTRNLQVVLLGEVARTGAVPIPFDGSLTLLQAIAEAGGFTGLASRDRVTVTRTVNGEEVSIRVRVSKLISGKEPDFKLQPNDVIMVPQILF